MSEEKEPLIPSNEGPCSWPTGGRLFKVNVNGVIITRWMQLDNDVALLHQAVQSCYDRQTGSQVRIGKLYSESKNTDLSPDKQLSFYFANADKDDIELRARAADARQLLSTENQFSSSSSSEEIHELDNTRPDSNTPRDSTNTLRRTPDSDLYMNGEYEDKQIAMNQRMFYLISLLSFLWNPVKKEELDKGNPTKKEELGKRNPAKKEEVDKGNPAKKEEFDKCVFWRQILGQLAFFLLAVFYIFYIVYCPFLGKHGFAFSLGNPPGLSHVYFIVQGIRYLVFYVLGMWECYKGNIHFVIKECSTQVVGNDQSEWNTISRYMTYTAVVSIVFIMLPGVFIIPALASMQQCNHHLYNDTLGLLNSTVPVEVGGYILFNMISLPLFLTILFIVKLHETELKAFSNCISTRKLEKEERDTSVQMFKKIQSTLHQSSKNQRGILSVYYFTMLLWLNVCVWLVVHKWVAFHYWLKSPLNKIDTCWIPPEATRYTTIFVTQLVWFYVYPLYCVSKLPRLQKKLVVEISRINYERRAEKSLMVREYRTWHRLVTIVSIDLDHEPRFTVFWCLPISVFTTVLLVCITPVLPIVWKVVTNNP
ncbi:uncharacterized protein LOC134194054 [Corticium candelabrum]|uniref:uncharacterized protein LOC134194054 n=1 Tax=Corticium candelabrum TaxID=121492 RepID=UPI002E254595|nr:uncharacterized protein LOC134194054 [Corticium candelabrum]